MKIIAQDLLSVENGVICHAVNTQGTMGAGLAKVIAMKWPKVYESYVNDIPGLGEVQMIHIHSRNGSLWVANLATQDNYGHDGLYTSYTAVTECLRRLSSSPARLYFPWKMCCGLGGGDWDTIMKLLLEWVPTSTICYFQGAIREG